MARILNTELLATLDNFKANNPVLFKAIRKDAVYCADNLHGRYIAKFFRQAHPELVERLLTRHPEVPEIVLVKTFKFMTANACKLCGGATLWAGRGSWLEYCSAKCRANCPEFAQAKIVYNLEKYGAVSNLATPEHQLKKSATLLATTGYAHAAQNPATKKKTKATNLNRYGVSNPMKNKMVVAAAQDKLEAKYGVRATWYIPGVRERKDASMLERHGDTSPIRIKKFAKKIRTTNLKRLGVDNPFKSKAVMGKVYDERERRTGYRNAMANPLVREKAYDTIESRTGYRHQMKDPAVFAKGQATQRKAKPWVDRDGVVHMVRGIEPLVNAAVEARGGTVVSCEPRDMPVITYRTPDGKSHRYYPDAVALVDNVRWVIEAKESNGLFVRPGEYEKNKLKFSAAILKCSKFAQETVFVLGFVLKDREVKFVSTPSQTKLSKIEKIVSTH